MIKKCLILNWIRHFLFGEFVVLWLQRKIKHTSKWKTTKTHTIKLFNFVEEKISSFLKHHFTLAFFNYILRVHKMNKKEIKMIIENLPEEVQMEGLTGAEVLKLEGKQTGQAISDLKNRIENTLILLLAGEEFTSKKISLLYNYELEFVKTLERTFQKGEEKKARKVVLKMFEVIPGLEENDLEPILKMVKNFSLKFKKKNKS